MISLAKRLTLLVIALLCLCWVVAGLTFYGSMRRTLELELQHRLAVRLAWLGAAMSVDNIEGGQIKLHRRRDPDHAAEGWRIATSDGKVLWESPGPGAGPPMIERSKDLAFGSPTLIPLAGRYVVSREEWVWREVPAIVREAVNRAVPGLVADVVDRQSDGPRVVYVVQGRGERRTCFIRAAESGQILGVDLGHEVDLEATSVLPRYRLTGKPGRIELRLTAWTSAAAMHYELARLAWGLKTIGPLTLFLTGALVAVLIRWQLRPLAQMAEEAGRIGPGSLDERIGPVGSSVECVQLSEAINGMLDRLAESLVREHQFASTAAHELRTPLAQLRTTIEVALRRERSATEYRAALVDTLADVERLQKLVLGLLHLARSTEHASTSRGRPVALSSLLQKLARDHGPLAVAPGPAPADVAVDGDEDLFLSALGNVLENAGRHAPGAPPALRIDESADLVGIVVADLGPGIPEADRERVFQPLARLNRPGAVDDGPEGFGLGLTVARAAVRAYGGDLVCRPRGDGLSGTEFVFTFRKPFPRDDAAVPAGRGR